MAMNVTVIQLKSEFSLICTFAKVNSLIFQKILNILFFFTLFA